MPTMTAQQVTARELRPGDRITADGYPLLASASPVAAIGAPFWSAGELLVRVTFASGVTWREYPADLPVTVTRGN